MQDTTDEPDPSADAPTDDLIDAGDDDIPPGDDSESPSPDDSVPRDSEPDDPGSDDFDPDDPGPDDPDPGDAGDDDPGGGDPGGGGPGGDGADPGGGGGGPGPVAGQAPSLGNLPEKPIAALYSGLSTDWGDPMPAIRRDLSLKGYQGAETVHDMTIAELKALGQGVGAAVLFAHGSVVDVDKIDDKPTGVYVLATSQVVNPEDDKRFAEELKVTRGLIPPLVPCKVAVGPPGPNGQTFTMNYGITASFVAQNWQAKFCQDSVLLLCACEGLSTAPAAKKFVETLHQEANVGYVLGWDDVALTTDMSSAAIFIVDRLLGGNDPAAKPGPPPQRPFDIAAVLADIDHYTNVTGGPLSTSTSVVSGVTFVSKLATSVDPAVTRFGILAPSILNLEVLADQTQLAISGCFGDDPGPRRGVVKINELPVPYLSWAHDQIICPLLVHDEPGPLASLPAGMVIVEVDGRPSNAVPLTEWRGKLVFTVNGEGTQKIVCTWTYHLKADVHWPRFLPGPEEGCFLDLPIGVFAQPDSSLIYEASGTMTVPDSDPPQHVSWSGSGTLRPFGVATPDPRETFVIFARIVRPMPPDLAGSYMLLDVSGGDGRTWTYEVKTDDDVTLAPAFGVWESLRTNSPDPLFEGLSLKLPLDDRMGITAGTYPFTVRGMSCELSVQPEPTNYPPDPEKGEDQLTVSLGLP